MWTCVYMTQNIESAKVLKKKIEGNKIIAMLRIIHPNDAAGDDCFEILVPDAELKEALDIIID